MRKCEYENWLMLYHDGELDAERRRRLEAHLPACARCRAQLERLRGLSHLLAQAEAPAMPDGMMGRLHEAVATCGERAIITLCRNALLATAALLALTGGLWLYGRTPAGPSSAPQAWEVAAVTLDTGTLETDDTEQITVWMVRELSRETK